MNSGINRRDFLKFAAATGVLVASGEALRTGAMAEAATGVTEVDKLTIWILADNYYDANRDDGKITKRYRMVPGSRSMPSMACPIRLKVLRLGSRTISHRHIAPTTWRAHHDTISQQ